MSAADVAAWTLVVVVGAALAWFLWLAVNLETAPADYDARAREAVRPCPPPPPLPRCRCALTPYPESSWSTVSRLCPRHGPPAPRPLPTSTPS